MIRVVAGLCVDKATKKVLMALRRKSDLRPDMWEYPGGKMEQGEFPAETLAREWREELDVGTFVVFPMLGSCEIPFEKGFVRVMLYQCEIDSTPQPKCSQRLDWVDPEHAIRHLPCVPSTYLLFPHVRRVLLNMGSVIDRSV